MVEHFHTTELDQNIRLLHFHINSQIANITNYRKGFHEAIRYYNELHTINLPIDHINVNDGLNMDYDGTHSRNANSINYDMQDYANTMINMLKEFCDRQEIPHPHIFSENGRAMTAHHAVLLVQITNVERHNDRMPKIDPSAKQPKMLQILIELLENNDPKMIAETY